MDIKTLTSDVTRFFFVGAFLFLGLAVLEKGLNIAGQTIPFLNVEPNRLLDWASTPLLFVIALLLRQIRDDLRGDSGRLLRRRTPG